MGGPAEIDELNRRLQPGSRIRHRTGTDAISATEFQACGRCHSGRCQSRSAANLVDVGPFVDRLATGFYQEEADTDQDEAVNLVDVPAFVGFVDQQVACRCFCN